MSGRVWLDTGEDMVSIAGQIIYIALCGKWSSYGIF